MKTINLALYSFNELDMAAKEKALTKYRHLNVDFDWWDNEYEDFIEICSYLGVTVDKESIRFSGFYSQGDGSGFSGTVDILKLIEAIKGEAWKAYAPMLEFLFPELDVDRRVMALVANGILPDEPQIISRTRQYGVAVDLAISVVNENDRTHDHVFDELDKLEEWVRVVAEKLNDYLYHALEIQYEFLTSDNALVDTILVNEYLFTADGRSADHLTQLTESKS